MVGSTPILVVLELPLTITLQNVLSSHWLLFHITIIATMVSGERGMNSVAMTIISSQIDIGRPKDQTSDLLSNTDRATGA